MAKKKAKKAEGTPIRRLKDKTIYPAWDCGVIDNEIVFKDKEAFHTSLIPFEGKDNLQLVLKKKVKSRSRQEEKYYHGVVVKMIGAEMDLEPEEVHEMLKRMFLKIEERMVHIDGRVIRYERVMSTTELGDKAYQDYWKRVQRWAALPTQDEGLNINSGLGLYIPDPNEADWDGREEYFAKG